MLPPPCWNFAGTEVLFFYKLDIPVVSAIFLSSLGSVLVHYFLAANLLYLSVALCISYPAGEYIPVS